MQTQLDTGLQPGLQPGDLIAGKYRVDHVLGEGGMGIVVAATNEALRQKVAIKLLRPGALENAEALGRFKREAQAAASLRSQHVARVLDVSALEDGRPFMVMEMLEGQDLGDVIEKNGPIPVNVAVDYLLQASEAIAEAHAAGIVHRDLKPKNLFLTRTVDGRPLVKVLDFGISKVIEQAATNFSGMELTKTTEVIGSPSYMSPEQLRSARYVDHRTDIWALGVILYELLSSRLPFYAQTVTELVLVVSMEQERPVSALRPDVPGALSDVITRCLAKNPDHRIQNVAELVAWLEPFAQVGATTAAERVRKVALQSGKQLPPAAASSAPTLGSNSNTSGPSSSARIHVPGVHAGTSVAWGQTQMDPPRQISQEPPRLSHHAPAPSSNGGMVAAIVIGALVVLGGLGSGAFFVIKRTNTANAANPPPAASGEPVPLPPGRKDLPPIASASAAPAPSATEDAPPSPSALPTTRTLPSTTSTAKAPPKPKPANPKQGDSDDLSNIGRR